MVFVTLLVVGFLPFIDLATADRVEGSPSVSTADDLMQVFFEAGLKVGTFFEKARSTVKGNFELGLYLLVLELEDFLGGFDLGQFSLPSCDLLPKQGLPLVSLVFGHGGQSREVFSAWLPMRGHQRRPMGLHEDRSLNKSWMRTEILMEELRMTYPFRVDE